MKLQIRLLTVLRNDLTINILLEIFSHYNFSKKLHHNTLGKAKQKLLEIEELFKWYIHFSTS